MPSTISKSMTRSACFPIARIQPEDTTERNNDCFTIEGSCHGMLHVCTNISFPSQNRVSHYAKVEEAFPLKNSDFLYWTRGFVANDRRQTGAAVCRGRLLCRFHQGHEPLA
ncbi:hypothetical protein V8F44DRAFT_617309 [Aspergillus fumigatus]